MAVPRLVVVRARSSVRTRVRTQGLQGSGQRIEALCAPGEILVSGIVKELVAGSGIEFDDRGEYELKGVPGTWRLFAARL